MQKKRVIIVSDGDKTAQKAVEEASQNLGLRVISKSAGNPTPCSGKELIEMIQECPADPIVLMVDDEGNFGYGKGERAMERIIKSEKVDVLGIVAVASNAKDVEGVKPEISVTRDGKLVSGPVNKGGELEAKGHHILEGDTVDIVNNFDGIVIGIGDIGKMSGKDYFEIGAPITTKALEEVLKRSGVKNGQEKEDQ
ncbi:stage V sporulation protein AE [Orenia marismortui]|uniref:Stage V sporulation protein AE n=1 Tax=Orenia marismortui TaxID=46469 RepID=A0A4R8H090_9FIRM|nr:stage V sporulation protein AE [Orenia marismortui]TDX51168.1 stage V sporulation protein AE [Orenia marismortui]